MHEQGYRLWWDEGIRGGDTWWRRILERLNASCFVLLFVTPNASDSEWVADEVFEARNRKKKIFPVYLERVPNLTLPITRYHFIEQWACTSEDDFHGKICGSLPKETKQPEPKPARVPEQAPVPLSPNKTPVKPSPEFKQLPKVGSVIPFGPYKWCVLDVQDDKALLITDKIVEERPYNDEFIPVTWETCTLRSYLNGEFLKKFSEKEQAGICKIENTNLDNQWYGANGGRNTTDKLFLLSLEEVVKYFGDSGQLKNKNPESAWCIDDQYNDKRVAKLNNSGSWWWLRSPGGLQDNAARVGLDGGVGLDGDNVNAETGGVRPALWLNL